MDDAYYTSQPGSKERVSELNRGATDPALAPSPA